MLKKINHLKQSAFLGAGQTTYKTTHQNSYCSWQFTAHIYMHRYFLNFTFYVMYFGGKLFKRPVVWWPLIVHPHFYGQQLYFGDGLNKNVYFLFIILIHLFGLGWVNTSKNLQYFCGSCNIRGWGGIW